MSEENDAMRLKAFERTGCLHSWLPNEQHDGKVCPQGLLKGQFQVPTVAASAQKDVIPEAIEANDAAILEEQVIIEEANENDDLEFENEVQMNN